MVAGTRKYADDLERKKNGCEQAKETTFGKAMENKGLRRDNVKGIIVRGGQS